MAPFFVALVIASTAWALVGKDLVSFAALLLSLPRLFRAFVYAYKSDPLVSLPMVEFSLALGCQASLTLPGELPKSFHTSCSWGPVSLPHCSALEQTEM